MVEEQILQAIADRVADDRLHFQIIVQEQRLYVYLTIQSHTIEKIVIGKSL